jgi:hypothetical protein
MAIWDGMSGDDVIYFILRITSNIGTVTVFCTDLCICGGSNPPVLSFLIGCDRPLGGSPWPIIELRS